MHNRTFILQEWTLTMLSDTHPDIEAFQFDRLRQIPAWRKAHMLGQMYETTKHLTKTGLRHRHPEASEAELRYRLAELLLGDEVAKRIYGSLIKPGAFDVD
jgi:hypothetical protein